MPPALSPKMVTDFGLPPNERMFLRTHFKTEKKIQKM
jgi:hypothetical protein